MMIKLRYLLGILTIFIISGFAVAENVYEKGWVNYGPNYCKKTWVWVATVTSEALSVFSEPDSTSKVVNNLPKGYQFQVEETDVYSDDSTHKVYEGFGTTTGYVHLVSEFGYVYNSDALSIEKQEVITFNNDMTLNINPVVRAGMSEILGGGNATHIVQLNNGDSYVISNTEVVCRIPFEDHEINSVLSFSDYGIGIKVSSTTYPLPDFYSNFGDDNFEAVIFYTDFNQSEVYVGPNSWEAYETDDHFSSARERVENFESRNLQYSGNPPIKDIPEGWAYGFSSVKNQIVNASGEALWRCNTDRATWLGDQGVVIFSNKDVYCSIVYDLQTGTHLDFADVGFDFISGFANFAIGIVNHNVIVITRNDPYISMTWIGEVYTDIEFTRIISADDYVIIYDKYSATILPINN